MSDSITKNTLLPISFIGAIIVATLWIGNVNSKAEAAFSQSRECTLNIREIQTTSLDYMMTIEKRLAKIEAYLEKASSDE